jgi:Protein of unknown function (DUF3298)
MTDKGGRVEIPTDVAAEVLFLSDRTCCVCRQRLRPVQLHHIDDHPENSVADNLAVLCLDCHRETQIRGGFDRKLDAAQVRLYKLDWLKRVEALRGGRIQPTLSEVITEKQVLRYFQIREENEEYYYDFEADYVLVGSSDQADDSATNTHIDTFIKSSHQRFREDSAAGNEMKRKSKILAQTRFAYWDSLAISNNVSLYIPDLLSLEFQVYKFGAGAAHGNSMTKTMNFRLHPSKELQLHDVFKPSTNYLGMLSEYCFNDVRKQQSGRQSDAGMGPDSFKSEHDEWLLRGTAAEDKNYRRFSFAKGGIRIHFDPYWVACYAEGKYEVFIPSYVLKPVIQEEIAALLNWN